MLGLALAFPLCIGTALVLGTLVTYAVEPKGDFVLLLLGVIVAFAAVCLASFVQTMKDRQLAEAKPSPVENEPVEQNARQVALVAGEGNSKSEDVEAARPLKSEPSFVRKVLVCVIGGILMGLWNPLVALAEKDGGVSPYGEFTSYTFAVALSSLVLMPLILTFPLEGGPSTPVADVVREISKVPAKGHLWSMVGGLVWALGTLANAVAGSSGTLSSAESYAIGQCANLIAILWGAFYFKEFAGTDWKVKSLLALVCVLYLGAIAFIAASSK